MDEDERTERLSLAKLSELWRMLAGELSDVYKEMPGQVILISTQGVYRGLAEVCRLYVELHIILSFQAALLGERDALQKLLLHLALKMIFGIFDDYIEMWMPRMQENVFESAQYSMKAKFLAKMCTLDLPTVEKDETNELISRGSPENEADLRALFSCMQAIIEPVIFLPGALILLWTTLDSAQIQAPWLPYVLLIVLACWQLALVPPLWVETLIENFFPEHVPVEKLELWWAAQRARKNWNNIISGHSWSENFVNSSTEVFLQTWRKHRKSAWASRAGRDFFEILRGREHLQRLLNAGVFFVIALATMRGGQIMLDVAAIIFLREIVSDTITSWRSLQDEYQGIVFLSGSFDAFQEFMNMKPVLEISEAPELYEGGKGMKIEFRNVTFTYPGKKHPSLIDVSFTVNSGETAAFVGYNGAGKSTMGKLMLRLYDPQEGIILINDIDIKKYDPHELHRHMGVIFQEPVRFDAESVGLNIGIACPPVMHSVAMLEEATKAAGLYDSIKELRHGLDTMLDARTRNFQGSDMSSENESQADDDVDLTGSENDAAGDRTPQSFGLLKKPDESMIASEDNGYTSRIFEKLCQQGAFFSGGQWQRLSLSRMFLRQLHGKSTKDATIDLFILDEPTSALDAKAESALVDQMQKLGRDAEQSVTTVYISHRFTTILASDRIICMKEGRVVENGSHEELMAIKDGVYRELFTAAAKPFQNRDD